MQNIFITTKVLSDGASIYQWWPSSLALPSSCIYQAEVWKNYGRITEAISTQSTKSSKNITFSSLRIRKGHPSWVAMLFSCWRPTGHLMLWAGRQRPCGREENALSWDLEDKGSHLSSIIGFVPFVFWTTSLNFSFCIYQMKITKPNWLVKGI